MCAKTMNFYCEEDLFEMLAILIVTLCVLKLLTRLTKHICFYPKCDLDSAISMSDLEKILEGKTKAQHAN